MDGKTLSNNISIKLWVFFILATLGGFFVSASFVQYCGDTSNMYSNLWGIKLVSTIIISSMSVVTIVDLFGLSKKPKDNTAGKTFVAGLAFGMMFYQIWGIIIDSNCFVGSWILPIPGHM